MNRAKSIPPEPVWAELRRLWIWPKTPPLLLAIVILVTFADSLDGGLVVDNATIIARDPRIQAVTGQNLYQILTRNYWWPTFESDLYRPLTTLSYMVNYCLLTSRTSPLSYHLVNLLLHWLNAWLVYLLAARFLAHRTTALLLALVFAVHPLTIEAVTNIIGRADLLAGLFMLAGLELHARLRAGSSRRPARSRFALGLCAALAVMSKESGVVLIALMLLDDLSNLPRAAAAGPLATARAWLRFIPWKNYLCILPALILLSVSRYELLKDSPVTYQLATDNPAALSGFWDREMTAVKVLGYDLELTFWPAKLSCDYSYNQIPAFGGTWSGADLDAWVGLAMVVVLAIVALAAWRRLPAVFFFLGFAFITLLPVSNLVITIGTIMGERFMYLPLVGVVGALAALVERLLSRRSVAAAVESSTARRVGAGLAVAIVLALATRTAVRNLDWHDNVRLWRSAVEVSPNSFKVYKGLATSLIADPAQLDECIRLAQRGLKVIDDAPLPLEHSPNGLLCDLTRYYLMKGDRLRASTSQTAAKAWYQKAEAVNERAVKADRAVNAAARSGSLARGMAPEAYHDVGLSEIYDLQIEVCLRLQRYSDAEEACRWALRLKPGNAQTYLSWANLCAATGRYDDAAVHLIQATILGSARPGVWNSLERTYSVLQPGAHIVSRTQAGISLDRDNPLVRQHVNMAFHGLIENLLESNYRQEADQARELAETQYGCPAAIFADLYEEQSAAR